MNIDRTIRTRLLEALLVETRAFVIAKDLKEYGPLDDTMRVYAHPILPGTSVTPWQIYISAAPFQFHQGVGGISDTTYDFDVVFEFPINTVYYKKGENTYLDILEGYRKWLFTGGSFPNKNGRLHDPDNADPSKFINNAIVGWQETVATVLQNNAGAEVPVKISFQTREDQSGARI